MNTDIADIIKEWSYRLSLINDHPADYGGTHDRAQTLDVTVTVTVTKGP